MVPNQKKVSCPLYSSEESPCFRWSRSSGIPPEELVEVSGETVDGFSSSSTAAPSPGPVNRRRWMDGLMDG